MLADTRTSLSNRGHLPTTRPRSPLEGFLPWDSIRTTRVALYSPASFVDGQVGRGQPTCRPDRQPLDTGTGSSDSHLAANRSQQSRRFKAPEVADAYTYRAGRQSIAFCGVNRRPVDHWGKGKTRLCSGWHCRTKSTPILGFQREDQPVARSPPRLAEVPRPPKCPPTPPMIGSTCRNNMMR